jgi:Tol biopolymer transport system component
MTRWTTMPDDELDAVLRGHLDWRSMQVDGAPDAQGMAWRLAGVRIGAPSWPRRAMTSLVVTAVVIAILGVALLSIGSRRDPVGPITNGSIVVANAVGWTFVDLDARTETTTEPCGGLCPGAVSPVATADGRTIFYIIPTPFQADGRTPTPPGWSLWRWDRHDGTTTSVRLCDECMLDSVVPSPDGRYVALVEYPEAHPDAPVHQVTVDAWTGQEIRRARALGPALPAWDAQGRLLVALKPGERERIDVATGAVEVVGRDLPDGHLLSSPDGRQLVLAAVDMPGVDHYVVDQELEHARLIASVDDEWWASDVAWAPDGTAIAMLSGTGVDFDITLIDLATGETASYPTNAVMGQLMWLPAE